MSEFGYQCEWCDGTVRRQVLPREVFELACGFVILEDVTVGVCDKCDHRYYPAKVVRRAEAIALGRRKAERTERVPVAHA